MHYCCLKSQSYDKILIVKKNLMNTIKQRTNLKKYMITLLKVCSKCSWYQYGEKPTKFFNGLEKKNALRGIIKTLLDDAKEITTPYEINLTLKKLDENLL